MLILSLLKGVPARTTKVVTVGGVLKREEMDIVMNPHDMKAIEAADFIKRRVGGKVVALTMGPEVKLAPLMKVLYSAEVSGVDETAILSDRKMAGADTLATSYAVSLGVKKVLERHTKPIDDLIGILKSAGYSDLVKSRAKEFYEMNLIPNKVYSGLPSVKDSIIHRFLGGAISLAAAVAELENERKLIFQFLIVSGIKTTDGETGSVGPQVAESLAEAMRVDFPHVTYVEDFDVDPHTLAIEAERRIGRLVQRLEMKPPALLTVAPEYRPRGSEPSDQLLVRGNNYRGKVLEPIKWNAEELGADPGKLGLAGSPTIVGPGVDIGKPPVQKFIGKSLVFTRKVQKFSWNGTEYGPFDKGDLADSLPEGLKQELRGKGIVAEFSLDMLQEEIFA